MGTTPAGVTKASTLISLGVIGMTPSSNICTEYDKATAGKKKNNQSVYIQGNNKSRDFTKAYRAMVASNSVCQQAVGIYSEKCHNTFKSFKTWD